MKGKVVKDAKVKHLPELDTELDKLFDSLDKDSFVSEWGNYQR